MMFAGVAVCAASVLIKNATPLSDTAGANPAPKSRPNTRPCLTHNPPARQIDAPSFTVNRIDEPRGEVSSAAPEETPDLAGSPTAPQNPGSAGAVARFPTRAATRSTAVQPYVRAPLTHAEIVQRARQVSEDADLQVARMERYVGGLTDDQAAGAFVAYAKESAAYDPSIPIEAGVQTAATTGGAGSGAAETQVYTTLDDDQQAAFGEEMLNRDLWWTEIVTQLAADFPDPTATASTEPVQPSAHQGDNIFDILNSAK